MRSIYKKEIATYFNSLIGYLAIGLYLLATGLLLWVFPDTSTLTFGYASLDGFFGISPYLFMFLIPAITMRSIAGEKADGTWDLLTTRPIRLWSILLGKYLGSLTIVVLALLPTLVYGYSIYQLAMPIGNVDIGAIIGSYIGLLFLGAIFTAIGIFSSALNNNVIIAFLTAVCFCFLIYYAFDALSSLVFFSGHANILSFFGIQSHYEAISRGVLDSRDLIYFLSVPLLFLWFTRGLLAAGSRSRQKALRQGLLLIGGLALANFLASFYFSRVDFTADKRFTLSPLAKQTVNALHQEAHITVFLDGKLPASFVRLQTATADLLRDLTAYSAGKLTFRFINPMDGNMEQQQKNMEALADRGITPTNLNVRTETGFSQQLIFPAALITYGENEISVPLLQSRAGASPEEVLNNSVQNLEYAFVSALRKVTSGGKPLIGFTEGHGELDNLQLHDAIQSLMEGYEVGFVNLDSITVQGLSQLKVLIVAKPTQGFTETEKFKINHFIMNGGRALWAIDQLDADLDSLRATGEQTVIARSLNLDDLLFSYGIRFNYDLIADMNAAQIPVTVGQVGSQAQVELAPWLFYPIFVPTTSHPMLKNLNGIRSEFAGTLDTIAVQGVHKTVILQSSPFSRLVDIPATISLQLVEETPDPAEFKNKPYPVAALLEGEFPSVFAHRPIPAGIDPAIAVSESGKKTKMVAIADGDVFKGQVNPTDGSPYPLGWDRYTEQQYGNKSFLLNAIDYLTDDTGIITLREKEVKLRLLDPIKIKAQSAAWQLFNVALPPALLLLLGFLQHYLRKRKYSRPDRLT
ncbi:gliding motility-associated ABC transporter substrate-binding protein GldG [Parapedobacter koreensis]|uniref:Protein involved in gliding motility GldG n=1 Tax=Parapedobacter koreensis TaxID=332977 RepID=A0A1H7I4I5_9SPHI|nr:gliding motility-associated ABC transporter substrate-binding protein GldG [Parapedobacter koreensis]SEK57338.1 protein involved in gliding motility GldG [Parapedobacter koreensis]